MATTETKLLAQLQIMLGAGQSNALRDEQLLERFTRARDQLAFAALVRRHGPMILNVCRRVLHNATDAEDAFQATFLVLARKAGAIGKRQALAAWLHQVAYRVALRARRRVASRRSHEQKAAGRFAPDPLAAITGRELLTVLDKELQSLPAPLRGPLILCYLEELTREEAARQLGVSVGTLKRRLERGRACLRRRLERRGLALSAAFLTLGSFHHSARAALPDLLAAATIRAGMHAAGKGLADVVSAPIVTLVSGTLRAMALSKVLAVSTLLLLTATLMGVGFGIAVQDGPGGSGEPQAKPLSPPASPVRGPLEARDKRPQPAESLPVGARARLGTERFLNIGRVFALAYSPDGRLLASGAWDGSLRIWQTATGKEQLLRSAHQGPVRQVAFSPDGKVLASAGSEPGLCLWEVASGRPTRTIKGKCFSRLAFSPDGRKLAAVSAGTLHVWDESGKELWSEGDQRTPPQRLYTDCAFRGPDTVAAILYEWKRTPQFSSTTYLVTRSLGRDRRADFQKKLPGPDPSVSFAPDATFLAVRSRQSRSRDAAISYIPLHPGRTARSVRVPGQSNSFLCVSPDRRMMALSGDFWGEEDGRTSKFIQIVEICTGQERCRFEVRPDEGKITLAFSPDCRTLSSGSVDVTVLLWDLTVGMTKRAAEPLTSEELAGLWNNLRSPNSELAYRALWKLVRASDQATEYLAGVLRPATPVDLDRINALVRDVGDERFTVRQRAAKEIARLEELGEPALRKALASNPALELRRRIEQLLDELAQPSAQKVREIRAVEVLERMHTSQADRLLSRLAHGAPTARLTREAVDACRRLKVPL